jgi:pimeloyl-ACP methyl ester carboxylesterase
VVAYDQRGNGRSSDPPADATMRTFVEDAAALLDALALPAAHVYGQSFGGMVGLEMALASPDRVRSLILAATHAGGQGVVAADQVPVPKDEPWRALYAPGFPEADPDHVAEDLRIAASQPRHPEGERRQWRAMQGYDVEARLGEVSVPTLVLHGTEDRVVGPGNAHVLARGIPGAELRLLEGAGHLYHSEQADAADAAVRDFVARHAS